MLTSKSYYITPHEEDANVCDDKSDIKVNCAGSVQSDEVTATERTRKDFYLIYVTEGFLHCTVGNFSGRLEEGVFILISPETVHKYSSSGIKYNWVHFTGRNVEELLKRLNITCNAPYKAGLHSSLLEYWQRLYREFMINDEHFDMAAACILTELLTELSRYISQKNTPVRFIRSIDYINVNYSKNIKVADLARLENLSEAHYRSCFKEVTGKTPSEYINDIRITVAASLLEDTDKSVSEISAAAGYNDVYYFIKSFKKKKGITPNRYRKKKN
ncbi:MAG: AraC family transcriptional regulator [Ruminococcaceae bacterium]|nr:AraC family transcriptional regulator [Oscillospiraceae bacterium]